LRLTRFNEFRNNAQPNPPDGESRKSSRNDRSEGGTIVRAYAKRKSVLVKKSVEHHVSFRAVWSKKGLACQDRSTEGVHDGKRIAVDTIGCLEMAFEVNGPKVIRFCGAKVRLSGMREFSRSAGWNDAAVSLEDITYSRARGEL
jgi:hypothetical protein